MSRVPILFREWWDDSWDAPLRTSRVFDQCFSNAVSADNLMAALMRAGMQSAGHSRPRSGYNRLWRSPSFTSHNDAGSTVNVAENNFQINIDVQQFSPEEVSVTADEDCITVEGRHGEKQDEHGYISRHFVRRYMLPAGHDHKDIVASISSDGILTVNAPKKALPAAEASGTIPIEKPVENLTEKSPTDGSEKST